MSGEKSVTFKPSYLKIVVENGDMYKVIPYYAITTYEYVDLRNKPYLTLTLNNHSSLSLEDVNRDFVKAYLKWLNSEDKNPHNWKRELFKDDPNVTWNEED